MWNAESEHKFSLNKLSEIKLMDYSGKKDRQVVQGHASSSE